MKYDRTPVGEHTKMGKRCLLSTKILSEKPPNISRFVGISGLMQFINIKLTGEELVINNSNIVIFIILLFFM